MGNPCIRWCLLLAPLALAPRLPAGDVTGGALVVVSSRTEAYEHALDGLSRELKNAGVAVTVARTGENRPEDLRNKGRDPRAVAALGPEAVSEALQFGAEVPVIAGMVLRSTVAGVRGRGGRLAAAATVDVPFEVLIEHFRRVYPQVGRVGVIRNDAHADPEAAELESIGRQRGLTVISGNAAGPQALAAVYSSLARNSQVIICFPDASLYNSATINALISASLRARVPIVGFSEGFVRAGALFSVYPDYEAVGRQTAAALIALMTGHPIRPEWPVKNYRSAMNSRVARLVDLRYDAGSSGLLTFMP